MLQPSNPILVAARLVKAILFSSSKPSKGFGPAMLRHTFRSHLRRAASRLAAKAASSWRLECEEWGSETLLPPHSFGEVYKNRNVRCLLPPKYKKNGCWWSNSCKPHDPDLAFWTLRLWGSLAMVFHLSVRRVMGRDRIHWPQNSLLDDPIAWNPFWGQYHAMIVLRNEQRALEK